MLIPAYIPIIISVLYLFWLSLLAFGWLRIRPVSGIADDETPLPAVAVIVAMRNEEENIIACLESLTEQRFPKNLYQVILVDDHSEDRGPERISQFCNANPDARIRYVVSDGSGKKAALRNGIAMADADIILTVDADCTMGPEWITLMTAHFRDPSVNMVLGRVHLTGNSWFQKWQSVEYAALIGAAGGAVGLNSAILANGANLAFRKHIFEKVSGYEGNTHIASGDDVFLLYKIHDAYRGSVRFCKDEAAMVYTPALNGLMPFLHQRIRWSSKIKARIRPHVLLGAALVYLMNLSLLISVIFSSLAAGYVMWFIIPLAIKSMIDFLFLYLVSGSRDKRTVIQLLLPGQFINMVYVVLSGALGLFSGYSWKGRKENG